MTKRSNRTRATQTSAVPDWWTPPWGIGGHEDPDAGWDQPRVDGHAGGGLSWCQGAVPSNLEGDAMLGALEAQFGQVRSKERVRDLAEVFTHQREVDAMLDMMPDAFARLDVKFLEPSSGSGNFITEILRRKLRLVMKADCVSQEHYEHHLLRAIASIYSVDISPENIAEARTRMAHVLLEHYQHDANTIEPTAGFLSAAALILGDNIVCGDTLTGTADIELCDWQPRPRGRFQRVWSHALVSPAERGLFWAERIEDVEPVHYSYLTSTSKPAKAARRKARAAR